MTSLLVHGIGDGLATAALLAMTVTGFLFIFTNRVRHSFAPLTLLAMVMGAIGVALIGV